MVAFKFYLSNGEVKVVAKESISEVFSEITAYCSAHPSRLWVVRAIEGRPIVKTVVTF